MTKLDARMSPGWGAHRLLALTLVASLLGCATPPPRTNEPPASVAKRDALHRLGFDETSDGWEMDLAASTRFQVDNWELSAEERANLLRIGSVLLSVGVERVTVEGHTDGSGPRDHNLRLAELRAKAVALVLVEAGYTPGNIATHAFGASRPVADNATQSGRHSNRRAVIIVPSL